MADDAPSMTPIFDRLCNEMLCDPFADPLADPPSDVEPERVADA